MTKQTKPLGGLADIQASPPPTPETTDQNVLTGLKRRLITSRNTTQRCDATARSSVQRSIAIRRENPQQRETKTDETGDPVKPKQAKPKQVKPQLAKPKRVNPPPLPPATESQTKAHSEAAITFSKSGSRKALARCKVTHSRQRTLRHQQPESHLSDETSAPNRTSCDCKRCGSLRRDTRTERISLSPILKHPRRIRNQRHQRHTPDSQALTQEKTQADNITIIAFLSQEPDKIWGL